MPRLMFDNMVICIFPCGQTRATLDQEVEARQSNLIPLPRKLDDEKNRQQGFYQCSGFIVTYIFRLLFFNQLHFGRFCFLRMRRIRFIQQKNLAPSLPILERNKNLSQSLFVTLDRWEC